MLSYINTKNYNYLELDGKYYIGIRIYKTSNSVNYIKFQNLINSLNNTIIIYNITMNDSNQMIRNISNKISSNAGEILTKNNNEYDYELLNNYVDKLRNLKRQLIIDNKEMISCEILIIVSDYSLQNLNYRVNKIVNMFFANDIICRRTNFNHNYAVKNIYSIDNIKMKPFINITNDNSTLLFPCIKFNIDDDRGIYVGIDENESIVNINFDDKKYKNSNMVILGSSGTGKSFFMKLLILRRLVFTSNKQFVIDSEGEYADLYNNYRSITIDLSKNINFNNLYYTKEKSLFYISENLSKIKKNTKQNQYNNIIKKIVDALYGNSEYNLVIFDISNVKQKDRKAIFTLILELLNYEIHKLRKSCVNIYIDELWKYIIPSFDFSYDILNMYKTIRKKNASIIASTQEINDLLSNENKNIGKGILNNSNFKFIFSTNYIDNEIEKIVDIDKKIITKIKSLPKGMCLIKIENMQFFINIKTFEFERNIIDDVR